jgi:hypothetical protein
MSTPNEASEASPGAAVEAGALEPRPVERLAESLSTLPSASPAPVEALSLPGQEDRPDLGRALGAELASTLERKLAAELPQELQRELAELVAMIPRALKYLGPESLQMLRSAMRALLGDTPNFAYARELKHALNKSLRQKTSPLRLSLLEADSPSMLVVLGLGCFAYVAAPLALWGMPQLMRWGGRQTAMGWPIEDLVLITIVGALGSVTSIMVRLQELESMRGHKPPVLILFGFFKPIIGMFFALFFYAALNSGLIPALVIPDGKELFFFLTIAFLAGFSERFAGDLLARVEHRALGEEQDARKPETRIS